MIKSKQSSTRKVPITNPKAIKAAQRIKGGSAAMAGAGKTQATDFFTFVRQQGVVGLAVGLAIGTAAGAAVKQIVEGFINPIVGFIIGGVDLAKLKWVVVGPGEDGIGGLAFAWGAILSSLITLLATALVIYWLIHIAKLDRIDKKKE
jgi:large conductance mechanosensitive channel